MKKLIKGERSFLYLYWTKPDSHYNLRSVTWLDKTKALKFRSTRGVNSNFRVLWIYQLEAFSLFQPKTDQCRNRPQSFPEPFPLSVMRKKEELWSRECVLKKSEFLGPPRNAQNICAVAKGGTVLKAPLNGRNIWPTFVQQKLNGCWANVGWMECSNDFNAIQHFQEQRKCCIDVEWKFKRI